MLSSHKISIDVCTSTPYDNWWDCEYTPFYLQYDGFQWEDVMVENAMAIERFQGKLYVGGRFNRAGGQPAANIAIWNEN